VSRHAETVRWAFANGYRVLPDGACVGPSGKARRPYFAPAKPYGLVTVRCDGRWAKFFVHKLAGYQLFGEAALASGTDVRHLDGNSRNNAHSNLAIGSKSDNAFDKPPELRRRVALQAAKTRRKITGAQARELVLLSAQGLTGKQLAERFGLRKGTVSEILSGKIYSEATGLQRVERKSPRRSEVAA